MLLLHYSDYQNVKQFTGKDTVAALFQDEANDALAIAPRNHSDSGIIPDSIYWPVGDKLADTIPAGVNIGMLNQVVDSAFDAPGKEKIRQTAAVVVVYKGQLLAEKYADGFTRKTPGLGWSMTKSLTNALAGILVKEGKLNLNDPAPVKEWANDNRSKITLNDLLHMNSGLGWTENYFDLSDVTKMLYKSDNMYGYAIKANYQYPPDSVWFYSSGTANIVSGNHPQYFFG